MLFSYQYINHNAEKLQEYVEYFFNEISKLSQNENKDILDLMHDDFKPLLGRSNSKLRILFQEFFDEYIALSDIERKKIDDAFIINNQIEILCNGNETPIKLSDLPNTIIDEKGNEQNTIKDLFLYLYKETITTIDFNIQQHYEFFYKDQIDKTCPFCGLNDISNFKFYREDYDHLLDKASYPMCAVNLKNLSPTCNICNQKFKASTSLLFDTGGNQRKAYFPYTPVGGIKVTIFGNKLPKNNRVDDIKWKVCLDAVIPNELEKVKTWATVYNIKERYIDELEKNAIKRWFKFFVKGLNSENLYKKTTKARYKRYSKTYQTNNNTIKENLGLHISKFENDFGDKYFLKKSFFEFILRKADDDYYESLAIIR